MMAGWAQVLQALMAIRAHDVISLNRIPASGTFAVLHELALLQGNLELLLVAVDLKQGRAQQAIRDNAQ